MVIFVKKQELVDEILKGRLFSVYQKQSARNAVELAIRLAKKTEGTRISSAETSLFRREAEGFIKVLQIYWNKCGRRSVNLKEKYPDLLYGNIEVPSARSHYAEGEASSGPKNDQRKKAAGRKSLPYHKQSARAKRRASQALAKRTTAQKLVRAARQRARRDGKSDLAYVLDAVTASPDRPSKVRRTLKLAAKQKVPNVLRRKRR